MSTWGWPSEPTQPRYIPEVLKGMAKLPRRSRAMRPPVPPIFATFASTDSAAAPRPPRPPIGPPAVLHRRRDVVGDDRADEELAVARAGDGAGLVVGVGSRADDGRVADPSEPLVGNPAGGSPRSQVPGLVEAGRADRPELVILEGLSLFLKLRLFRRRVPLRLLLPLELLPALLRVEIFRVNQRDALRDGERLRALADQHPVRRLLHHQPREQDRILDPLPPRDRAGHERLAVHDCGVKLVRAGAGEDSALARVEEGRVFEERDGRDEGG